MKAFWDKILRPACVYFTLMTLLYAAGVYAIYGQSSNGGALSSLRVLLVLVFALILSTANSLFRIQKLNAALRLLAHAAVSGVGFWLCLVRPLDLEGSGELMGLLIYFVVYAAVALVVILHRSQTAKKNNRESEYTSVYKK